MRIFLSPFFNCPCQYKKKPKKCLIWLTDLSAIFKQIFFCRPFIVVIFLDSWPSLQKKQIVKKSCWLFGGDDQGLEMANFECSTLFSLLIALDLSLILADCNRLICLSAKVSAKRFCSTDSDQEWTHTQWICCSQSHQLSESVVWVLKLVKRKRFKEGELPKKRRIVSAGD